MNILATKKEIKGRGKMIKHDESYMSQFDKQSIKQGLAKKSVYHMRFEGEEKDCLEVRKYFADNFKVYQLNVDRYTREEYELFYWSNESITGRLGYFTIAITGYKEILMADDTIKKAVEIAEAVKELNGNIQIAIQYTSIYDNEKLEDESKIKFSEISDKFVSNPYGVVGRIKLVNGVYGFFKKGARSRYIPVRQKELLSQYHAIG